MMVYLSMPCTAYNSPFIEKEVELLRKFFPTAEIFRPDIHLQTKAYSMSKANSETVFKGELLKSEFLIISEFNFPYLAIGQYEEYLVARSHSLTVLQMIQLKIELRMREVGRVDPCNGNKFAAGEIMLSEVRKVISLGGKDESKIGDGKEESERTAEQGIVGSGDRAGKEDFGKNKSETEKE